MPEIPEPIKKQCESKGGIRAIEKRLPSEKDMKRLGQTLKALAEPMRQKILFALVEQSLCACLLKEMLGISDSKLSYHLAVMKDAGLIVGRKDGSWIIYQPTAKGIELANLIMNM